MGKVDGHENKNVRIQQGGEEHVLSIPARTVALVGIILLVSTIGMSVFSFYNFRVQLDEQQTKSATIQDDLKEQLSKLEKTALIGPQGEKGDPPASFSFTYLEFTYNCTDPEMDGSYICIVQ